MPKSLIVKSYPTLLSQLKNVFNEGLQGIEMEKVKTYWRIGQLISDYIYQDKERADYGENVLGRLERDLGIARSTLQRLVKFNRTFPIRGALPKLSWMHCRKLITVQDKAKRELFAERAAKKEWSYRQLDEVIRLDRLSLEEFGKRKASSPVKLSATHARLFTYKILEPVYIQAADEDVVVDVGFYINTQVTLKGIAKPEDGQIVGSIKTDSGYTFKASDAKNKELYTYKAEVERVVDGDTIWVNIDCGFDIWIRQKLRLRGIDTPELDTLKGQEAKEFVEARLKEVAFVVVKIYKEDKYGRYLADIFYAKSQTDEQKVLEGGVFLNQELLDSGLARVVK
ncbi:DUF1016 N-terminal domain-containing protein [Candidatus Omnitrophota bacterium]